MALIYEINTRAWLRELSEKAAERIHLGNVPDAEINRWIELGFSDIWLMGVWKIGSAAREAALAHWRADWKNQIPSEESDVQGSPYAIDDYVIDPEVGTVQDILVFRSRINKGGMGLVLDFVPNHFSLDSSVANAFPSYFVQAPSARPGTFQRKTKFGKKHFAHGRDPYLPPWEDTIQVEHRNGAAQRALLQAAALAALLCDSFRCDMAMLVLPDVFEKTWKHLPPAAQERANPHFWAALRERVRAEHPYFLLIGEVYWDLESRLQEEGFDFTYNKRVYDFLMRGDYAELQEFLLGCTPEFLAASVHFLENHDEPRVASLLPPARHQAAAVLLVSLPGMALIHDGQLEGRKAFARIQMSKRLPEEPDPGIASFYERLLKAVAKSIIPIGTGEVLRPLPAAPGDESCRNLIVISWRGENHTRDLALVNLSDTPARCLLDLHLAPGTELRPLFKTSEAEPAAFSIREGKGAVELPPQSAQIVRMEVAEPASA